MSITFNCNHCGKPLTTSDDKAGRQAKCPGCGELVTVPEAAAESVDLADVDDDQVGEREAEDLLPLLPEESSGPVGKKTCPMCGEKIPRTATVCSFCGEELEDEETETPRRRRKGIRTDLEIGEVMSDSWEIFKDNFGICVGAQIITSVIVVMAAIPAAVLGGVIFFVMSQASQRGVQPEPPVGLLLGLIPAVLLIMAVATYMVSGLTRFFLTVARGDENRDLLTIFKGGKYFFRFLGYGLLYSLCAFLGICPGFGLGYLAVVTLGWPIFFIICDDERADGKVLSRALELTKPNWVTSLLIFLVSMGLQMAIGVAGAIPCIGPIISLASILIQPYFQLLWAVAYVKMSGQD